MTFTWILLEAWRWGGSTQGHSLRKRRRVRLRGFTVPGSSSFKKGLCWHRGKICGDSLEGSRLLILFWKVRITVMLSVLAWQCTSALPEQFILSFS